MKDNKSLFEWFIEDWKLYNRFLVIAYYGYIVLMVAVGIPLTVISAICVASFFITSLNIPVGVIVGRLTVWVLFVSMAFVIQKLWLNKKPRI